MTEAPDLLVPPRRVGILLAQGFTALHLDIAVDSLRIANRVAGARCFDVVLVGLDEEGIEASNGRLYRPDCTVEAAQAFDVVLVIAGYEPKRAIRDGHIAWLRSRASRAKVVAAIDTGTVFLARAGLAKGRRLAIHWEHLAVLASERPDLDLTGAGVAEDGRFITSSGGLSGATAMLAIMRRFCDPATVGRVAEILYHSGREPERATAGPADIVRSAERLMNANLEEPLSLGDLARAVGLHARTFARRFEARTGMTPMRRYRQIRLARARDLLKSTGLTIAEIALRTGFATPSGFATAFKDQFGRSPRSMSDHD